MNALQTQAVNNLLWMVTIFPLTALITFIDVKILGWPFSIENVILIFLCFTLGALVPLGQENLRIYRKRKEGEKIWFDERDQAINYKALLFAFYSIWIFLFAGFGLSAGFLGDISTIPFYILPLCLCSIVLIFALVYSFAILVQYRWGGKDGR